MEEEIEEWDGNLQKQKELQEQELKNNNTKTPNQAQNPHQAPVTQKYSPHSSPTL